MGCLLLTTYKDTQCNTHTVLVYTRYSCTINCWFICTVCTYNIRLHTTLTRFNKIAIQGTPQMAVDKEAICLSRVYSYYFKCNLPLFYVQPALTRYLSILFLNTLTLVACTQSVDNLFHTLMVLWENEYFLTSNLLCFFTRVKLCPLVILLF